MKSSNKKVKSSRTKKKVRNQKSTQCSGRGMRKASSQLRAPTRRNLTVWKWRRAWAWSERISTTWAASCRHELRQSKTSKLAKLSQANISNSFPSKRRKIGGRPDSARWLSGPINQVFMSRRDLATASTTRLWSNNPWLHRLLRPLIIAQSSKSYKRPINRRRIVRRLERQSAFHRNYSDRSQMLCRISQWCKFAHKQGQ